MRRRVVVGAGLTLIIVFALVLTLAGDKGENNRGPQCNTALPSNAVYTGQMDFKPGATNFKISQEFDVTPLNRGGVSIQDRYARVGVAVSPGSVPNETVISNSGDRDLSLRTDQGCVDRLPAHGEVRYGDAVMHLDIHYLTELPITSAYCEKLPPAGAEFVGTLMVDKQLKLHVEDDLQSAPTGESWTVTDSQQTVKLQISVVEKTLVKVALAPDGGPVVLDLENINECNVKLNWLDAQNTYAYYEQTVTIVVYRLLHS